MAILIECAICHCKQGQDHKSCIQCGDRIDRQRKKGTARYWISYRLSGKQRKEFTGYSFADAKDKESKRRGQKAENRILEMLPQAVITFSELSEWFMSNMADEMELTELAMARGKLRKGPSRGYFQRVKSAMNAFNAEFGDMLAGDITSDDLKRYCNRRERKIVPYTLDVEMQIIKSMINAAFYSDKVDGRVLKAFGKGKTISTPDDKIRQRAISVDEFERLVTVPPGYLRAMIIIGMYTGMRPGEIRALRWEHIDRKAGLFRLPREITKTRHARSVPIAPDVMEAIESLPRHLHGVVVTFNGRPITGLSGTKAGMRSACKKAGLVYGKKEQNGLVFSDLRRTAKTNML
jgi:integrase